MHRVPLRIGDELIQQGVIAHKMAYVGPIGPWGEDVLDPQKGAEARLIHFRSIQDHKNLRLGSRGPVSTSEQRVVQNRARQVLAGRVVNRTSGPNCEHISSYVRTGKPESPQLQAGVGLGVVALGLLLLGGA